MRMSGYMLAVIIGLSIVLAGCEKLSPTGNVVKSQAPVRVCAVQGFSCFVEAAPTGVILFNLRNTAGTDLENVKVQVMSKECAVSPKSIALGRFPGGAQNSARFVCAPALDAVTADIIVSYSTRADPIAQTVPCSLTIRSK